MAGATVPQVQLVVRLSDYVYTRLYNKYDTYQLFYCTKVAPLLRYYYCCCCNKPEKKPWSWATLQTRGQSGRYTVYTRHRSIEGTRYMLPLLLGVSSTFNLAVWRIQMPLVGALLNVRNEDMTMRIHEDTSLVRTARPCLLVFLLVSVIRTCAVNCEKTRGLPPLNRH